jgi:hypothetical protein
MTLGGISTAYRVETSARAMVQVGNVVDNAHTLAVDTQTGLVAGRELTGYGRGWHIRALADAAFSVESRDSLSSGWSPRGSGVVPANGFATGTRPDNTTGLLRITLESPTAPAVAALGWAITGSDPTDSEWNAFYLPAQSTEPCQIGTTFLTPAEGRILIVAPLSGTVTSIVPVPGSPSGDVTLGPTTEPWVVQHHFATGPVRVDVRGGPAAVLFIYANNGGWCRLNQNACGILEGTYVPPRFLATREEKTAPLAEMTLAPGCYTVDEVPGGRGDAGVDASTDAPSDGPSADAGGRGRSAALRFRGGGGAVCAADGEGGSIAGAAPLLGILALLLLRRRAL